MYTTWLSLFVSEVRNRRLLSQRQGWGGVASEWSFETVRSF